MMNNTTTKATANSTKAAAENLFNTVWEDVVKGLKSAQDGVCDTVDNYMFRNAEALDASVNAWQEVVKASMQIPGFYGIYRAILDSIVESGGSVWKISSRLQSHINEFVEDAEMFGSEGMREAVKRQFRKNEKGDYQPLALTALSCIFATGKKIEKKLKDWGADIQAHPVLGGISNAILGVSKVILGMAKVAIDGAVTIVLTVGSFVIKGVYTVFDLFMRIFRKIKETIVTLKKGDDGDGSDWADDWDFIE